MMIKLVFKTPLRIALAVLLSLVFGLPRPACAVILYRTGDTTANTTAPRRELAGSGWQYQGIFGSFLGTAIAPNFFITAAHVGGAVGGVFTFQGVPHALLEAYNDPFSDLIIWRVDGQFPIFAPLYSTSSEAGQHLVAIGRGTQRGGEVIKNTTLRGWFWGPGDGVQRWGENVVTSVVSGGPLNDYVYATFDSNGLADECHLSAGDSGGAIFIQEGGVWKLAGINYAVDDLYTSSTGDGIFDAAVFDARDFYSQNPDGSFSLIAGPLPVPTGFYASRISSKLAWIYSVIDPTGDADGNGVSNLVEYTHSLNAPNPVGAGAPTAQKEAGSVSIIYRKLVLADAPNYAIQQSTDLRTWSTVTANETLVAAQGSVHIVKATVPASGNRLFLRVLISPP